MTNINKTRLKLGIIFLLAVFCVLTVINVPNGTPLQNFWNKTKFHLGLDLQGGTHLVYQADISGLEEEQIEANINGVRDRIERRVNPDGLLEPVVQTNKVGDEYRVIVELAGVQDVNQAINMIGATPLLEFKEQDPNYEPTLTAEQKKELDSYNESVRVNAQVVLEEVLKKPNDFEKLAQKYSQDSSAQNGGDLDWVKRGMFVPEFDNIIFDKMTQPGIYPELVKTQFGYHIIKKIAERGEGDNLEIHSAHILFKIGTEDEMAQANQWKNTNLSGKNLKKTVVQFDPNTGEPSVSLVFDSEGKDLFAEITARNVGKPVAIFLDGQPISVPTVNESIRQGKAIITGRFNIAEAKSLVAKLSDGALPVPINLISQQTVGASLGQTSVDKSLFAGLIGLIAVAVFMILYYRLPGVLSVFALAIYTAIVLTIFKVWPVTLTLAGVAGFILSIGMAVDANVLIFERLKEELKNGRETDSSVEEGFKRAWTSIRDSNISTILTCLILMWFGTSIIKGFAITLGIGVLVSMFSAIFITHSFLRIFSKVKSKWIFGVSSHKQRNT